MSSSTLKAIKEILEKAQLFYEQVGLHPFLLSLPLQGPAADSNQKGIRDKILKNRSFLASSGSNAESTDDGERRKTALEMINSVVDQLTTPNSIGFVLLVTEHLGPSIGSKYSVDPKKKGESTAVGNGQNFSHTPNHYRPLAGGIVEFVDETERAIRAVWCRRSISESVAEVLLRVVTLQLIAYSFDFKHPQATNKRTANKLLSAVDSHCLTFPCETYNFLTSATGLNLGKHWETPHHGGNHSDTSLGRCQCCKVSTKSDAFQFWGISESRFISIWANRKSTLIPNNPPKDLLNLYSPVATKAKRTSSSIIKKNLERLTKRQQPAYQNKK